MNKSEERKLARRLVKDFGAVEAVAAAQQLVEIYFNIAAECIGEDEVRRRRDALLAKAVEEHVDSRV